MSILKIKNEYILEDEYKYPDPEIIIQSTRKLENVPLLGKERADNRNGYVYFYIDNDWIDNPRVYIGETKQGVQGRHNATHKKKDWLVGFKYPFIGLVNSPHKPWSTDTRRAIESLIIYKLSNMGFNIVNAPNSTWTDGGTVDPSVEKAYVEDVAELVVQYLIIHIGYDAKKVSCPPELQHALEEPLVKKNISTQHVSKEHSPSAATPYIIPDTTHARTQKANPRLVALVEGGKLPVGTRLTCSRGGYSFEGEIVLNAEGIPGVQCDERFYTSPSTAVEKYLHARRLPNATSNGWREWKLPNGKSLETLEP